MFTGGCIYIISSDFESVVHFYKQLLENDAAFQNKTRFAQFNVNGLNLAILNGRFDAEHPDEVENRAVYFKRYRREYD